MPERFPSGSDPLGSDPLGSDPLDDLRSAWQSLEVPEPADELADADPETRQVVDWMRAAWRTVEPERELPRPVPILRPVFRPGVLWRLAAAVLVAALAGFLWWSPDDAPEEPTDVVQHEAQDEQRVPMPERVEERPVRERGVQFASLTSEKIEMRSGPVRLVLVTGGGQTADEGVPKESSEEER